MRLKLIVVHCMCLVLFMFSTSLALAQEREAQSEEKASAMSSREKEEPGARENEERPEGEKEAQTAEPAEEKAEPKPKERVRLGEVVVTATRTERPIEDVPASMSVITPRDIEGSNAQTVEELLRVVPGIDLQKTSGLGSTNQRVSLRGVGRYPEARTLVLVDGMPMNNMYSGHVDWHKIPLHEVERVEVVRGPASALYGSSAMGGVINIITKRPEKPRETEIEASVGSFETYSGRFSHSQNLERFSYRLWGNFLDSEGYNPIPREEREPYHIKAGATEWNLGGLFSLKLDEHSFLDFSASRFKRDLTRHKRFYDTHKEVDDFSIAYERKLREKGGLDLLARLYYRDEDSWENFPKRPNYDGVDYRRRSEIPEYGGLLQTSFDVLDKHTLTAGIDARTGSIDRKLRFLDGTLREATEGQQDLYALFLQDEIRLREDLILTLGGRYDYWKSSDGSSYHYRATPPSSDYPSRSDSAFNPKAGIVWHATDSTSLRSSIGRGFRAPSLYELYGSTFRGRWRYDGNPDLDPETILSYEIGVDQWFTDSLLGRLTLYRAEAKDYIDSITTDPVGRVKKKMNIGQVLMEGIEAELRYEFSTAWSFFANHTVSRSKIEKFKADPSLKGNQIQYIPEHKSAFGVTYENPKIARVDLIGRYTGKRYADDENTEPMGEYVTFDLKVSRELGENATVSLGLENLLDREYSEYEGYLGPGRAVTVGLSYKF